MTSANPIPNGDMLTVVSPCYNEEQVIRQFYEAISPVLDAVEADGMRATLLLVDDGSNDGTLSELNSIALNDSRVLVYSLSRNFGHQVALSAGLDVAEGDAVVLMDSDLQHPPALIAKMLQLWREGHDVVSAVRRDTADAGLMKRFSSAAFYWIINRLSETQIVPGAADFCLLSGRARDALRAMPERHRFLRGMVSWIGFRRAYVDYIAPPRVAGCSKYTPWKMIALATDALMSFSSAPVRLASRLGLGIAAMGLCYLVYVLGDYWLGGTVRGWSSLIATVLILGGIQLTFIGIIGEYIARIFEECKGRPLYIFKQTPGDTLVKQGRPCHSDSTLVHAL